MHVSFPLVFKFVKSGPFPLSSLRFSTSFVCSCGQAGRFGRRKEEPLKKKNCFIICWHPDLLQPHPVLLMVLGPVAVSVCLALT